MSGGSHNYAYRVVAWEFDALGDYPESEARRAFAKHLALVGEAMRAIEWVDSADMAPGSEAAAHRRTCPAVAS